MIKWYVSVRRLIREMERKSRDALEQYKKGGKEASRPINEYLKADYDGLWELWKQHFPKGTLGNLGRHLHFGEDNDYRDIVDHDLPAIEKEAETLVLRHAPTVQPLGFEDLLHPRVREHAYELLRGGHLREAVLNSVISVFDFVRARTGATEDGDRLVGQVFSLREPMLILSELDTESGQNDQKGFMQIFSGTYQGIRNPKAHSLTHDLTEQKAAQYLVFASLLARRVEEATASKSPPNGTKRHAQKRTSTGAGPKKER
jgi:uncharacterized protein (TIGR02391 family)